MGIANRKVVPTQHADEGLPAALQGQSAASSSASPKHAAEKHAHLAEDGTASEAGLSKSLLFDGDRHISSKQSDAGSDNTHFTRYSKLSDSGANTRPSDLQHAVQVLAKRSQLDHAVKK